ncbi:hypothetical protein QL285_049898 [Trifolium repens]|nr:hypothetical protein QL285_049898 [Trifolium repens]
MSSRSSNLHMSSRLYKPLCRAGALSSICRARAISSICRAEAISSILRARSHEIYKSSIAMSSILWAGAVSTDLSSKVWIGPALGPVQNRSPPSLCS